MTAELQSIPVDRFPIRLGQFLKLGNMVQDGLEAKIRIQEGEVRVNGEVEIQRGKQLQPGDVVILGDLRCQVEAVNPDQ